MAQPFPLDNSWTAGMRQDMARDALPGGAVWNMVDFIPNELQAPIAKRGGWTYTGGAMAGVTQMNALCNAQFATNPKILGIDQAGNLWDVGAFNNLGSLTSALVPLQNPIFYRSKAIIPANDGTTIPKYWDNSVIANLTGAFPGKYAGVFKDHLVLGASTANPNRLAFSNAADPTTWDLTLQVWDSSFPLVGIGILRAGIVCFHSDSVEIIRGSIPPPGGDFSMVPLVTWGCLDARSIVNWNDQVIWASAEGVFQTDGASVSDLTDTGGMVKYWRDTFLANYTSSYKIVSGVYRNHLFISLLDGSNVFQDCLVCDLRRRVWYRFSNFPMRGAVQVHSAPEELYVSMGARVAKVSSCWNPTSSVKADADGTNVLPYFESGLHRGFMRLHRRWIQSEAIQNWKAMYATFDMRDSGSDLPTLRLSLANTPEAGSYTQYTGGAGQQPDLPATTVWGRKRVFLGYAQNGLSYKLEQVNPSASTKIYSVEAEYSGREGSSIR
jgi:hypothetical protein